MGQGLFEEIKGHLAEPGVRPREGTIGDATIQPPGMEAPSSIQNQQGERVPEMWRVKKGNQYHFGMKLHIGVDAETGIVHSLSAISAKVQDVTEAHRLLYGGEQQVWGDAGYIGVQKRGVQKREENLGLDVDWRVAMKPGKRRHLVRGGLEEWAERRKASVRAKVEHPFLDVKRVFGYAGVRYQGLAKNRERMALLLGLSNLKRAQTLLAG